MEKELQAFVFKLLKSLENNKKGAKFSALNNFENGDYTEGHKDIGMKEGFSIAQMIINRELNEFLEGDRDEN
jgi:hypothetical protein